MEGEEKQADTQDDMDSKPEGFDIYPENLVMSPTSEEPTVNMYLFVCII